MWYYMGFYYTLSWLFCPKTVILKFWGGKGINEVGEKEARIFYFSETQKNSFNNSLLLVLPKKLRVTLTSLSLKRSKDNQASSQSEYSWIFLHWKFVRKEQIPGKKKCVIHIVTSILFSVACELPGVFLLSLYPQGLASICCQNSSWLSESIKELTIE